MGNPYVKMLSLVDPNKAAAEFHQLRGGKPNGNITYNAANGTSPNGGVQNGQTTLTLSDNLINTINTIGKYLPIALAIIALNALVVLVLAVAAVIYMCRRRNRVRARKTPGRMTPMPMNEGPQSTYEMPVGPIHTYQPVSMALTEDTFVPPSPAFQKDGSKLRPMSVA